jgi:DNA-binding MarR family transcriptional regulator
VARAPARGGARERELTGLSEALKHVFRGLSSLRGRDTHLGQADVSHAQYELLVALFDGGQLSVSELAGAAQLAPATVTQMLDHLVLADVVERVRSVQDRRVVVCKLTGKGRAKVLAKRQAWRARWELALGDVPVAKLAVATEVLNRIAAMLAEPSVQDRAKR